MYASCSFIATVIVNTQLQTESTRADRLQNELEHMTAQNRGLEKINLQLKVSNQICIFMESMTSENSYQHEVVAEILFC